MPRKEGDEEPQIDYHEEQQARDTRHLPELRHQNVQDRKGIVATVIRQ